MTDLGTLRAQALEATSFRGHDLTFRTPWHGEYASRQIGECVNCGMEVYLDTRPMPNGIELGGEALALTCPKVHS